MLAVFTIPLFITLLDSIFLLLCHGLYRLIAHWRRWATPAPSVAWQLLLTLGLQAVLLVLLLLAEPLLRAYYHDWTQVAALIGVSSTAAFPVLLLIRHLLLAS